MTGGQQRKKLILFVDLRHIKCGMLHWRSPSGEVYGVAHPPGEPVEMVSQPAMVPHGVRLAVQPATKTEPLEQDASEPGARIAYDQGVYRSWYIEVNGSRNTGTGAPGDVSGTPESLEVCYVESRDGYQWSEPRRCRLDAAGLRHVSGGTCFIDPAAPPPQRYKLIYTADPPEELAAKLYVEYAKRPRPYRDVRINARWRPCIWAATSPDGLSWRQLDQPLMMHHADTDNTMLYDEVIGKYVLYTRMWRDGRRWVGRAESEDFRHWSPIAPVIYPRLDDPLDYDVYLNAYSEYPGAREYRLMFPTFYHRYSERSDIRLYSSADGIAWHQVPGGPAIPPGEPGRWDGEWLTCRKDLVPLGEGRLAVPIHGTPYPHKYPRWPAVLEAGRSAWAWWPDGRLCAVRADREGEFWTIPMQPAGRTLRLNFRTQRAGRIRVGVVGASGRSVDDCQPLWGDSLAETVCWNGRTDVGVGDGEPVVLHVQMRCAELFALQWA